MKILAADWVFPITSGPLQRHAIEIENGKIVKIRPAIDSDPFLNDTCLLPGLINAHTHLAYTGLRNLLDDLSFFPWIRKLTEIKMQKLSSQDISVSTKLGIAECLRAGITTVADMSDLEPALEALSASSLRGVFYWEVFGVEKEQMEKTWADLKTLFPRFRSQYSTNRLSIGVSPHACYTVRPELYRRISEWAQKDNVPVSFHVSESREEEEFISKRSGPIQNFLVQRAADWKILGNTCVEHLAATGIFDAKPLLAHLVQASATDLELLAHRDITVAHCPKSNAKLGHGIAPVTEMLRLGIRVGLGTDSAASNNRLDLFEEGRFALLQQRARGGNLTEMQVLEMMTIRGAEALRMQKQIGSLEPGKEADLVAVKVPSYYASEDQVLRHLVHNSTASDVKHTWIGGAEVSMPEAAAEAADLYRRSKDWI